jgi:hypothetical protein
MLSRFSPQLVHSLTPFFLSFCAPQDPDVTRAEVLRLEAVQLAQSNDFKVWFFELLFFAFSQLSNYLHCIGRIRASTRTFSLAMQYFLAQKYKYPVINVQKQISSRSISNSSFIVQYFSLSLFVIPTPYEFQAALALYIRAVALNPFDSSLRNSVGQLQMQLGAFLVIFLIIFSLLCQPIFQRLLY